MWEENENENEIDVRSNYRYYKSEFKYRGCLHDYLLQYGQYPSSKCINLKFEFMFLHNECIVLTWTPWYQN